MSRFDSGNRLPSGPPTCTALNREPGTMPPPNCSSTCRNVLPNGISTSPGCFTLPPSCKTIVPRDRSVPIDACQAPPRARIFGIVAKVSTLLTIVGRPYNPASSLERFQERRLFSAHIGASADDHLDFEGNPVEIQEPFVHCLTNCRSHRRGRCGIFMTAVDVSPGRSDGAGADQHTFDQPEGISLHDHAIAIGARITFISVGDHILVIAFRLSRDLPFGPHRKGSTATPAEPRDLDLFDDRLWRQVQSGDESLESALRLVGIKRQWFCHAEVRKRVPGLLPQVRNRVDQRSFETGFYPWEIVWRDVEPGQPPLWRILFHDRFQVESPAGRCPDQLYLGPFLPGVGETTGSRCPGRCVVGEIETCRLHLFF